MLVELFAYDDSVLPPITTSSQNGLLFVFNQSIPFDYGSGVYMQIGYNGPHKKFFSTIEEYVTAFNARIDELYRFTNLAQPMYDAVQNPTKFPREKTSWKSKQLHQPQVKRTEEADQVNDNSSLHSDLTSTDTTSPEVKAVFGNMVRDKKTLPCHVFALNKECTRDNCPYSHDKSVIEV